MSNRANLQTLLESILGSKNVYYQSPSNVRMEYDAIRYSLSNINSQFANDQRYKNMKSYEVIVITRLPDPEVVDKLLQLPYTSPGRPYIADNLYHYPITLYY